MGPAWLIGLSAKRCQARVPSPGAAVTGARTAGWVLLRWRGPLTVSAVRAGRARTVSRSWWGSARTCRTQDSRSAGPPPSLRRSSRVRVCRARFGSECRARRSGKGGLASAAAPLGAGQQGLRDRSVVAGVLVRVRGQDAGFDGGESAGRHFDGVAEGGAAGGGRPGHRVGDDPGDVGEQFRELLVVVAVLVAVGGGAGRVAPGAADDALDGGLRLGRHLGKVHQHGVHPAEVGGPADAAVLLRLPGGQGLLGDQREPTRQVSEFVRRGAPGVGSP